MNLLIMVLAIFAVLTLLVWLLNVTTGIAKQKVFDSLPKPEPMRYESLYSAYVEDFRSRFDFHRDRELLEVDYLEASYDVQTDPEEDAQLEKFGDYMRLVETYKARFEVRDWLKASDNSALYWRRDTSCHDIPAEYEMTRDIGHLFLSFDTPDKVPPDSWSAAVQFCHDHQDLIGELRRIAAMEGLLRPVYVRDIKGSLAHLPTVRNFAQLLRMDALVHVRAEQPEPMIADIVATLQLADAIGRECLPTHLLLSVSLIQMAHNLIRDALPAEYVTGEVVNQICGELDRHGGRHPLVNALAGEAHFARSVIQDMPIESDSYSKPKSQWDRLVELVLNSPLLTFYFNLDHICYFKLLRRLTEAAALPSPEALATSKKATKAVPFWAIETRINAGMTERLPLSFAVREAYAALIRLGLAVELFRNERGSLPDTLEDAIRSRDWELPLDPFTGQKFVYKPSETDFQLYSLGPNGVDDGGIERREFDEGDIVWRGRKPAEDAMQGSKSATMV